MKRHVSTFAEFLKNDASKAEKGSHELVNQHYSGEKKGDAGFEDLSDPKDSEEKGGKVEHTEEVKADDLADPKNAQP